MYLICLEKHRLWEVVVLEKDDFLFLLLSISVLSEPTLPEEAANGVAGAASGVLKYRAQITYTLSIFSISIDICKNTQGG